MTELPPGQQESPVFPRFGLTPYAKRFPTALDSIAVSVTGDVHREIQLLESTENLQRVTQTSDFHCVTTWSHRNLSWSGFRFADVYNQIIRPEAQPSGSASLVILRAQDGYRTGLPLSDLLEPDVLLADQLNGQPLTIEHGAPLRVIAPAHYGYKNVKHLKSIEFRPDGYEYRPALFRFMDHPRARVALEERGTTFPGWLLRRLYRPMISSTRKTFERALADYRAKS